MSRRRLALVADLPLTLVLSLAPRLATVVPVAAQSAAVTPPPVLLTEPGTWCRASGEVSVSQLVLP